MKARAQGDHKMFLYTLTDGHIRIYISVQWQILSFFSIYIIFAYVMI